MDDAKKSILNKIYKTKSARFNADSRLRFQHHLAHYTLMLLSVYIVALAVAPKFDVHYISDLINTDFWSLILSIAVMGVAAMESGNNRLQKAYHLHKNALEVNALYRKAELAESDAELTEINQKYTKLLDECEYNHDTIDALKFDASNKWATSCERNWAVIKLWFSMFKHYGFYWFLLLMPLYLVIYSYFAITSDTPQ